MLQGLRNDIALEIVDIRMVLKELDEVLRDAENGPVTPAIRNGGAALVAQCYSGIENILKRIAKYGPKSLPNGPDWHIELLTMFSADSGGFLDQNLIEKLTRMRKFRHVVHHGYGFKLHWESVHVAMNESRHTVEDFINAADAHIQSLAAK